MHQQLPPMERKPQVSTNAFDRDLLQLVSRLETVLDDERDLLANAAAEEFDRVIALKNQLALEVMRFTQKFAGHAIQAQTRSRLRVAMAKLGRNAEALKLHINAVGEISALVNQIYVESNSDGTYTGDAARQGRRL